MILEIDVSTRPVLYGEDSGDFQFLLRLFSSQCRDGYMHAGWTPEQVDLIVRQQFEIQHAQYRQQFPRESGAEFLIIEHRGRPIGRLYVNRAVDEIRVIDITLLPTWCGQGIGGALLEKLIDEAQRTSRPVRLHVAVNNRARRLYESLGFKTIEERGLYLSMECPTMVAAVA